MQPSRETLHHVADALRLEPLETKYLLELGGFAPEHHERQVDEFLQPSLVSVVHELCPCPCIVVGRRCDILLYNDPAEALYGDLSKAGDLERNGLWHHLGDGPFARMLEDRPARAAKAVAIFRVVWARWLEDPFFAQLVHDLSTAFDEFKTLWAGHEVAACDPDEAVFQHPELGLLAFEHSAYDLNDSIDRGVRLLVYTPQPRTDTRIQLGRFIARHCIKRTVADVSRARTEA